MDDLISRQAAIDELKKISFSLWVEFGEYLSEDTREIKIINSKKALEAIDAMPTAQPKKGKWILIRPDEDKAGNGLYECSECGKGDIHAPEVEVPFCWNCGAYMRGGEDG